MGATGLSLFLTVLILHLNYKTHNNPVPRWLTTVLFIRRNSIEDQQETVVNPLTDKAINNNGKFNAFDTTASQANLKLGGGGDQKREKMLEREWKTVVSRIDHVFFFFFLFLFALLLIIMVYPYNTSAQLDKSKCSFA